EAPPGLRQKVIELHQVLGALLCKDSGNVVVFEIVQQRVKEARRTVPIRRSRIGQRAHVAAESTERLRQLDLGFADRTVAGLQTANAADQLMQFAAVNRV